MTRLLLILILSIILSGCGQHKDVDGLFNALYQGESLESYNEFLANASPDTWYEILSRAEQALDQEEMDTAPMQLVLTCRYYAKDDDMLNECDRLTNKCTYLFALQAMEAGDYEEAYYMLKSIEEYEDARELAAECEEKK